MASQQANSPQSPMQQDDGIPRSIGPLEPSAAQRVTGEEPIRAAIFVIHGMGQQIPFETLDQTATGFIRAATFLFELPLPLAAEFSKTTGTVSQRLRQEFHKHGAELADDDVIASAKAGVWKISATDSRDLPKFIAISSYGRFSIYAAPPKISANTVRFGKQKLPRAEFEVKTDADKPMVVHVYEGYWAPLTEGKVLLRDIMSFAWNAGLNGITNWDGNFNRFMFGRTESFPITGRHRTALLFALMTLLMFSLIIGLYSIVATIHIFQLPRVVDWPSVKLLNQLLVLVAIYIGCVGIVGVPLFVIYQNREWIQRSWLRVIWRGLTTVLWWMLWGSLLVTILVGLLMLWFCLVDFVRNALTVRQFDELTKTQVVLIWVAWGFLLFVFWQLRRVFIQSLGDVVAYVSSHKLDRFMEIRDKIKECVYAQVYEIYHHRDETGKLYYDQVGFMGHSLGSVIAYDTLNTMLLDDESSAPAAQVQVAERTKVLMTFGSPLDKTAYVFARQGKHTSPTREALATSIQPLLQSYERYRNTTWINVYSPRDIIGSALTYYDLPEQHSPQHVQNVPDRDALMPLLAHVELWATPTMFHEFYQAFTGNGKW